MPSHPGRMVGVVAIRPMTTDLEERQTDDALEFLSGETVVGRLVWADGSSKGHTDAGWWLEVPGATNTLLYRAPAGQAEELEQARQNAKSASVFFAKTMVADRVAGRLGTPRG
jgi:hypothetical protein